MIRLSGSVKLRCALAPAGACSGSGTWGLAATRLLARALLFFFRARPASASARRALLASAFCSASCSSSALASAIFFSRLSRRAISSGSSSPRFPLPYCASSAASVSSAAASSSSTSCLQLLFGLAHAPIAHRLVLAGVALSLVPSIATCPSFTRPAF